MAGQGTFDEIRNADTFATAPDHADALEAADYKNYDQSNMQSDVGVVTRGTSAPSGTSKAGVAYPWGGVGWQDTNAHSDGPSEQTKVYNGAASAWVSLAQAIYSTSAPSSAYERPSMLWRDETLHIWRRYESATTSPDGVAGWQPLADAFQLWKNESGADVPKGAVVIHNLAGTVERAFATTTIPKHAGIVGVTAETISNNAYGVLAPIAGGAQVDVLLTVATYGAGVKGDLIVADATAGYGRQSGPAFLHSATYHAQGLPVGAFAELLSAATVDGLHPCRMLGQVGTGMLVMHQRVTIYSDTTPSTSLEVHSAATLLADAAHDPIVGWQGYLKAVGSDSVYSSWRLLVSNPTNVNFVHHEFHMAQGNLSNPEYDNTLACGMIPTTASSSATLTGNLFGLTYLASDGSPTWTTFDILRTAYMV